MSRWRRPRIWRTPSSTRACTSFPCRWIYTPLSTVLAARRLGSTVRIRWRWHPTTSGERWARASPDFFVTTISATRRCNRWRPWLPTVAWWRMSNRRWSISTGWTWPTLWGAGTSSTRILFALGQWISKAEVQMRYWHRSDHHFCYPILNHDFCSLHGHRRIRHVPDRVLYHGLDLWSLRHCVRPHDLHYWVHQAEHDDPVHREHECQFLVLFAFLPFSAQERYEAHQPCLFELLEASSTVHS